MVHRMTAPESRYGSARLIAVADSTLVSYDYRQECPIPVPDQWRAAIAAFEGRAFQERAI
jgi:acyl-CoA thioesterase FadM